MQDAVYHTDMLAPASEAFCTRCYTNVIDYYYHNYYSALTVVASLLLPVFSKAYVKPDSDFFVIHQPNSSHISIFITQQYNPVVSYCIHST